MSKKVLILSGSPRKGGNSDLLCDEFMKGALESGNEVEKIRVGEKKIAADVLVLASPVYFYSIDAQLKALIDRTVARWTEIKNKEFYYIATAADSEDESLERTIECMRGYADCVEGAAEKGVIYGGGFYEAGEVRNSPVMIKAYEMGKSV